MQAATLTQDLHKKSRPRRECIQGISDIRPKLLGQGDKRAGAGRTGSTRSVPMFHGRRRRGRSVADLRLHLDGLHLLVLAFHLQVIGTISPLARGLRSISIT